MAPDAAALLEPFFFVLALLRRLLPPRVCSMLDVVSTHLGALHTPSAPQQPSGAQADVAPSLENRTYSEAPRPGFRQRARIRQLARENARKTAKSQRFPIKQLEWNVFLGNTGRPFPGLCCAVCSPNSADCYVSEAAKAQTLQNVLCVDAQHCTNGYLTRRFCHLFTVWHLKKYEYPQLSSTVLKDEKLYQAIEAAAKQDSTENGEFNETLYQTYLKKHEERAVKIVMKMRSTLSDFWLRLTSWLLYKLLPCFLTSVAAHPGQLEMLRLAGQSGLPLIFLPLHRSHLDYILISFILLTNNIRSPLVAAGDNLRIPVFGWLLRGLGAFFIKRRMDPTTGNRDIVYRAALHTYMVHCLRANHNMEFFIEGGRTRTGKPSMPKGGLLSVIVDAYIDGTIEDALLVPVSVNYEKLVDGNFVRELLGQPKKMETFGSAVKGIWSVLNSNYGMMRIDFNQPFSLRELVLSFKKQCIGTFPEDSTVNGDATRNGIVSKHLRHVPSSTSLFGTDFVDEKQRFMVEAIARHILFDAAHSQSIMSTNAVAFLLLHKYRAGATLSNLVRSLDDLRRELALADKDVGFMGESIDVINHAVELLGPGLVRKERRMLSKEGEEQEPTVFVCPIIMLPNVIELSYYSNTVVLFYVVDAVLVTALYALLKFDLYKPDIDTKHPNNLISKGQLLETACELCDILRFEFIFAKPCQNLEAVFMDKIYRLIEKDILVENEEISKLHGNHRYSRVLDESSDEDDDIVHAIPETFYSVNNDSEALRKMDFLHGLLRPLVDTYFASARVLEHLIGQELIESDLICDIISEVKTQLSCGQCLYGESLSVDPVKNSLKLFECWEVLECYSEEKIKLYYLTNACDNECSVRAVQNKIQKFKWVVGQQ